MKRGAAYPSNYLKKEDFPAPIVHAIASVSVEKIKNEDGDTEDKVTVYFAGEEKGMILNQTNWYSIADIRGEDADETDTDNWPGTMVEVFNDPSVSFGKKRVGGIRIRQPAGTVTAPISNGLSMANKNRLSTSLEIAAAKLGVSVAEVRAFALDYLDLEGQPVVDKHVEGLLAAMNRIGRAEDGALVIDLAEVSQEDVPF